MWEWIGSVDRSAFLLVNGWRAPWLDLPMFFLSIGWLWAPVFLLLLWLFFRRFRSPRDRLLIAVGIAVCIAGTDLISSSVIKPSVRRLRPAHDQSIGGMAHIVRRPDGQKYRGGRFGFVSSHAANYFGLATLGYWLLRTKRALWLFAWAALISYSRIYLGVHFPGDVVAGALLGVVWGSLVFWGLRAAGVTASGPGVRSVVIGRHGRGAVVSTADEEVEAPDRRAAVLDR